MPRICVVAGCLWITVLLAGCGKKVTAQDLLETMEKNAGAAKSVEAEFSADINVGVESSGVSMSMDMGMEGKMEMLNPSTAMHIEGSMSLDIFNLNIDFEMYNLLEDGKETLYVKAADQWMKTEAKAQEEEAREETEKKYSFREFVGEMELSEETEKTGDREVYVLSGKIEGNKLKELLEPLRKAIEKEGKAVDFSKADIPLTLEISKESGLPAAMEIDLGNFANVIFQAASADTDGSVVKTENCRMAVTFTKYDGIESIEIPPGAANAPERNIQDLTEDFEDQPAASEFALGTVTDRTYTSEFLGLQCTVPEGWTYYTEEQMREMNKAVYDAAGEGELKESITEAETVFDMVTANEATRQSINIVMENTGLHGQDALSESAYLDISMDKILSGLEDMGITELTSERNTVEIAGESREGVILSGKYQGDVVYEQLVAIAKGGHMACVTFTCFNEDTLEEMEEYFGTLEGEG